MTGSEQHLGVVVGVDGSGNSDVAVRWAAHEAAMRKERLTLVQAIALPIPGWPPSNLRELCEADAEAILDDAVTNINDFVKDGAPSDLNRKLLFSQPASAMVDMSKNADMVVVGARGLGALRRVLLGSVSTALIHHAHCPVAVIHQDASLYAEATTAPVLLGTDASAASELATEIAFDEAAMRGVDLLVLHAASDTDMSHILSTTYSTGLSAVGEMLTERLAAYQERYPGVSVQQTVVDDRPATHLVNLAASAQLVVVGSHGRGGFAGMALGSVGTAVAHASRTPVIVARSQ
ncbi:universal stress protein [Mycobacterium cookii]|uniref:Universal stress protein n=1 Tax=Mycobacterium cookii TaxID=1775 RepID=A0A7I7KTW4_9MYCO|nr:universal stress protein [Mycobacterium cookii]MCV7330920.1 universal stress protein [Mycobacterium cookii]BBX45051.1 universal stress protein [Mycobacterium cookii]